MSYLKINGSDEHYNVDLQPFTTQHNKRAVKFIGDKIPSTDQGFKLYNDDDEVIADLSAFTHEYNPNSYSVEEDIIENPEPNNEPLPPNPLDVRLSQMSQQINAITPYVESKTAYIDDTEVVFDKAKDGNILVSAIDSDGDSVDVLFKVDKDKVIAEFSEPLEKVTKVTMSIQ